MTRAFQTKRAFQRTIKPGISEMYLALDQTAEHVDPFAAVRAGQVRHVLDHAYDALMQLGGQRPGPLGYLGRGELRRGHHDKLAARHQVGSEGVIAPRQVAAVHASGSGPLPPLAPLAPLATRILPGGITDEARNTARGVG